MNPPTSPAPPSPTPAWIRGLPAAGGLVGSLIGGGIGGVGGFGAGALVPGADLTGAPEVVGAVGGAKLGSTAGAGIGGGLGQTAEDALTGKLNLGTFARAGGSALENAIGNLVGEKLFQGGSMLVNGAKSVLERGAAQRAGQAAEQTAADEASQTAKAATDRATQIKNNYGGISAGLQKELGLGGNIKFVDSMGMDGSDPYALQKASEAGLDLNSRIDSALGASNPISMDKFGNQVFDMMQKQGVTDLTQSPLGKAMSAAGMDISKMPKEMPATQVRTLMQRVGDQIGNYQHIVNAAENNGVINTEAQSQLDALRGVYKDLGDRIYTNNPEFNSALQGMKISDTEAAALKAKYGDQLAQHIVDTVNNASSAKDVLPEMQRFVNMSTASKMAINDIENAPATARGVARVGDANPTPAKPAAGGSPNVLDALSIAGAPFTHGASLLGLIPRAIDIAKSPAVQDAALAGLDKASASAAAKIAPVVARAGGIAAANLPNEQPQPAGGAAAPVAATTPGMNPMNIPSSILGQDLSAQGALLDEAGRIPANYGGTGLAGTAAQFGGLAAGLAPTVQKQALAGEAIAGVNPAFENAGGAQGPLGGLLTEATAMIPGSAANTYQREQATAAAALAQLLGITPAEAMGLLPRVTQTPQTAGTNQAVIGNLLGTSQPNLPALPALVQ